MPVRALIVTMTHLIVQCDECLDEFLEYHEKDIRRHIKKNKVNKYRSTGQKHTIVVLQCDISTEIMTMCQNC